MNEIEYRLERAPPINEDPEDEMFEEVPQSQQVRLPLVGNFIFTSYLQTYAAR